VPLADILDYLHLGARAGKAATGMPTSRITGSGLLRVGVEEAPSRVARYNSTAAREVTGVREVSEAISGGVPSLASEPRRAVDEVAGVFAPRDELFREGVAPTVIDLVDPTDYTDGLKHYNIDRIDPKTHAGILEGIANALTDGNLSDNDRQFFTTLFDEILSPENSILTGGAFNQSKSDFTTTRAIHNALITARRKLQEKSGSVYIPKTIEEMTAYTDTSTLAGKKYSKLFSDTYTPVLGRALGSLDAFKGHDPKLIRETLEGVQKIRQKSRGAGMKKEEVQTFLQEVSGILRADKKEADKLREIQLLRDKYLRKVSADQFVMHIDY
jgi:hypothetical protein